MKTASVALSALLNGAGVAGSLVQFDLYTFILANGAGTLLYTNADFPITAADATIWNAPKIGGGTLWTAGMTWAPKILGNADGADSFGHWKLGLDADGWNVTVAPRPFDLITGAAFPDTIGGVPWIYAARSGAFDNAELIVSRAYFAAMPAHPIPLVGVSPVGTLIMFRGLVGPVDCTTSAAHITASDWKSTLSQQMPKNVYQAGCRHRLFDARCTLSAGTFSRTGAVVAGSTRSAVAAVLAAPAGSGTFVLGTLTMTSGLNAGFSRLVSAWDGTVLSLQAPFPFAINVGETFTVTAGCNKSMAACTSFANLVNFSGEPFTPNPEVSLG